MLSNYYQLQRVRQTDPHPDRRESHFRYTNPEVVGRGHGRNASLSTDLPREAGVQPVTGCTGDVRQFPMFSYETP